MRRDPAVIRGERLGRPGRWVVVYYPAAGSTRTWRTFKSLEAAKAFRLDVLKTRARDPRGEVDYTVTLGDYVRHEWLPFIKANKAQVKPSSVQRYEQTARLHLLPTFKDHKVALLERVQIKRLLVTKLSDGWSRATVRLMLSTLRLILNAAVEDKIIKWNPCRELGRKLGLQASPGSVVNDEQQVKAFNQEELTRFFDAAKHSPLPYGALFWVLGFTGLRVGEGVALRWVDFDLAARKLHVRRTLSGGFLGTPKSGRDRVVDLSERAAYVLKRLQDMREDRAKHFNSSGRRSRSTSSRRSWASHPAPTRSGWSLRRSWIERGCRRITPRTACGTRSQRCCSEMVSRSCT
jgi:integrase